MVFLIFEICTTPEALHWLHGHLKRVIRERILECMQRHHKRDVVNISRMMPIFGRIVIEVMLSLPNWKKMKASYSKLIGEH